MNDYGLPDDVAHFKTVCQEGAPCEAVIAKERRQVACVGGMRAIAGVIVAAGIFERFFLCTAAGAACMDMESVDAPLTGTGICRESCDSGKDENAFRNTVKGNFSIEAGILGAAGYGGVGLGEIVQQGIEIQIILIIHFSTTCFMVCRDLAGGLPDMGIIFQQVFDVPVLFFRYGEPVSIFQNNITAPDLCDTVGIYNIAAVDSYKVRGKQFGNLGHGHTDKRTLGSAVENAVDVDRLYVDNFFGLNKKCLRIFTGQRQRLSLAALFF